MDGFKSLPFATYDIAVYLPGGAVLLLIVQAILGPFLNLNQVPNLMGTGENSVDILLKGVFWLSACYLTGHLGAFISTYSVERLVHDVLGFPSDNWLEREKYVSNGVQGKKAIRKIVDDNISRYKPSFSSFIVLIFQSVLIIPIGIFLLFRPIGFYSPKIPDGLSKDLAVKYHKLNCSVPFDKNTRWEKVVEHYVANNCPAAYVRMYNYLVIYGALRLLSLILLISCWGIVLIDLKKKSHCIWDEAAHCNFNVDISITLVFVATTIACFLSMMAFAKFNRRYFEESILAFLLAPHSVSDIRK